MREQFEVRCAEYRDHIQAFMHDHIAANLELPQRALYDAMEYSLLAGGKRIRPILAMEFCRMCGADWQKAAPFAAAVEMIHTYSLIHDDLPCMDNDDYRRGRPTNHKVYGEALALLAGDALLTDAFSVATTAKTAPDATTYAVAILAECAGSRGMVGGQVLDIMSEERTLSEQEVIDIQTRKTGRLITAACTMGVVAGGGTPAQLEAAATFAGALGLAFQIRDDMLDVIGTKDEMGKSVGTDETKNTFVRLYGLDKCEELVCKYTDIAIDALAEFDDNEFMKELALSLTQRRN